MQTEQERAAEEYKATLSELNSNSKFEINALTMLAEDNKEYAVHIAACIENQLKSVPNSKKLPVLYLIDSICKNYPKSIYVGLFTQNIVSNFCNVFKVSDERVRRSLHKLRMTWNTTKIFPTKKLNAIDERVHEMDPNWPVLHRITSASSQQKQPPATQPSATQQQQKSQQHHNQKQHQQQKQQHQRQQHQQQSHSHSNPQPELQQTHLPVLESLYGGNPQPELQPVHLPVLESLYVGNPQPELQQAHLPVLESLYGGNPQPELQPTHLPVLESLYGGNPQPELQPAHLPVLESLYGGKQCSNCSRRCVVSYDNNRYAIHLDWHFRQNLKGDNMFARRKWYYPLNLWVQFREINDDDLQKNDNTDSGANDLILPVNDHEAPSAPASKDDAKNICSVCHETFEKFWAEDEEEWRLKNAKLYEDERVYHPLCLKDMLQASIAEVSMECG